MSVQTWENIVKQIEQESDAAKIAELAKKLNDAMVTEEREKVKQRLAQLREALDVMDTAA
jgi:hypothetical protein